MPNPQCVHRKLARNNLAGVADVQDFGEGLDELVSHNFAQIGRIDVEAFGREHRIDRLGGRRLVLDQQHGAIVLADALDQLAQLLGAFGLPVPKIERADTLADALSIARRFRYPVSLAVDAPVPLPIMVNDLGQAMRENPHLKVLSANGWFDLATPFFATEYDLAHLGLDAKLRNNVTFTYYPSGHMVYLNVDALKQF